MNDLLTSLQLLNKTVVYKELKLKHYKTILKCLISDPIDTNNLILNLNSVLTHITNLTEDEVLNLNLLEYLLLLIEIRITSIGSSIFAIHKINDESINIEIPLYKTLQEVQNCLNDFKSEKIPINDSITLNYSIPTVKDLLIKKSPIFIKENIDDLPACYLKNINPYIKKFNNFIKNYYFFKPPTEKYIINLSLNPINYILLIKILYNEDLFSVYSNIFYLSKLCNMSAEYLENCTYGEFKIFVKKTEEFLQRTSRPSIKQEVHEESPFEQVDINSLYGNDEQPENFANITRSEFTP